MKNFVQRGDNITLAAPATVTSGAPVLVNSLFGIAAGDAASGASVDLVTVGVFDLAKVSTDTFAVGEVVYWDDSASLCTSDDDSAANPRVGLSVAAAANPSSTVRVRLDG